MPDILVNNFISGEISRKMRGRVDLGLYRTGVSKLENFLPMVQGGFTRRPGTKLVGSAAGVRLIPFTLTVETSYLIELGDKTLRIWLDGVLQSWLVDGVSTTVIATPYLLADVMSIQFAQDYQSLYLAHRGYPVKVLSTSGGGWTFGTLQVTTDSTYAGMFTGTDVPGCVSYCANRLWFASSYDHPFRLWTSRPFEPANFETFDIVQVVDEVASAAAYIAAIEAGTNPETQTVIISKEVNREDNGMVLGVGLNRNDRIEWLSAQSNLIVGTSCGEWIMPGNISPQNKSIVPVTAYGSVNIQAIPSGSDLFFIQSGGKRLRCYQNSAEGYSCVDMNFSSDHMLSAGVVQMAWQRIPEPRLYCVLGNGDMAVLSYDRMYGMSAWARWTFAGNVKSVCVTDNPTGQDVSIIIDRNGVKTVECFDFESSNHSDQHNEQSTIPFNSLMVTTPYDFENTVGRSKRVWEVGVTVIDSGKFLAGPKGREEAHLIPTDEGFCKLGTFSAWTDDMRISVMSSGSDPLTVLSIVTKMEVGS